MSWVYKVENYNWLKRDYNGIWETIKLLEKPEIKPIRHRFNPNVRKIRRESPYDDPEYRRNRIKALERDGYRCRICGSTERLNVHHIVPISMGGTHELENLITLCYRCHATQHRHMRGGWNE